MLLSIELHCNHCVSSMPFLGRRTNKIRRSDKISQRAATRRIKAPCQTVGHIWRHISYIEIPAVFICRRTTLSGGGGWGKRESKHSVGTVQETKKKKMNVGLVVKILNDKYQKKDQSVKAGTMFPAFTTPEATSTYASTCIPHASTCIHTFPLTRLSLPPLPHPAWTVSTVTSPPAPG